MLALVVDKALLVALKGTIYFVVVPLVMAAAATHGLLLHVSDRVRTAL